MVSEEAIIDYYSSHLLDSGIWIRRAGDLLEAAQPLEAEVGRTLVGWDWDGTDERESITNGVVGVYFMLVGFALENLLKAKLITLESGRVAAEVRRTRKFPTFLKSHNLAVLARRSSFPSRQRDDLAFEVLTRAVVWDGRYPLPMGVDDIKRETQTAEGSQRTLFMSELQLDDLKDLVRRVRAYIVIPNL